MLRAIRGDGRRSGGILAGQCRRPIDPDRRGQRFWTWGPVHEPLGVRGQARAVPARQDPRGAAIEDVGRRQIGQAAVMVGVVVPREQIAADAATTRPAPRLLACDSSLQPSPPLH